MYESPSDASKQVDLQKTGQNCRKMQSVNASRCFKLYLLVSRCLARKMTENLGMREQSALQIRSEAKPLETDAKSQQCSERDENQLESQMKSSPTDEGKAPSPLADLIRSAKKKKSKKKPVSSEEGAVLHAAERASAAAGESQHCQLGCYSNSRRMQGLPTLLAGQGNINNGNQHSSNILLGMKMCRVCHRSFSCFQISHGQPSRHHADIIGGAIFVTSIIVP